MMRKEKLKGRLGFTIAVMAAIYVWTSDTDAWAYSWHECNNTPSRWQHNYADYQIMQCSIPAGSQRADDVLYSFTDWNAVYGMWDVFAWQWGSDACSAIKHNNGTNEIYYGVADEMDGAFGVTYVRYSSSCFWWYDKQWIIEADIAINGDYTGFEMGNPPCDTYGVGSRTTIVHEMGHALGLNHYDHAMAHMMTNDGEGKYCGSYTISAQPDDAAGGRFLYSSGNDSHDLGASEFRYIGPNDVSLNNAPGLQYVCPGDSYTFRWSIGNMGTVGDVYDVRWYLSTNDTISTSDIYLGGNTGGFQDGQSFTTWTRTVTIPNDVEYNQIYYLGTFVDWNEQIAERYESNNRTYSARKLRIRQPHQCL